ncbi:MAG TPA: DoxX family protein [Alphaproteobacteria bacterium]|nr:DoxX family protein [Alphaproteobacteria bacterium]
MASFMKPWEGETYAVLRIIAGLLFFVHGTSKIFGYPVPPPPDAPAFVVWGAGLIELVGGGLIAAGFMTRWAAFICSGTMAVAYWIGHGTKSFFPMTNGGELAVIYCFVFLFIAAHGAGKWSVDAARA